MVYTFFYQSWVKPKNLFENLTILFWNTCRLQRKTKASYSPPEWFFLWRYRGEVLLIRKYWSCAYKGKKENISSCWYGFLDVRHCYILAKFSSINIIIVEISKRILLNGELVAAPLYPHTLFCENMFIILYWTSNPERT